MGDLPDDAKQFSDEEKLDFVLSSPTRRLFRIDVGNLPKGKAEDYIKKIMEEYREKHKDANG